MTEQQFKELKAILKTSNAILFAGFTAMLQQISPIMDEQEARDAIISCLTSSMEEVEGILDETKNK